jgi:transcriptional regulator with XRE-family HTH domain
MFRNLGVALRVSREQRGLNQAEVARRARIGKSQLSKYERGKELPKLESLERILRVLESSVLGFFYTLHLLERTNADLSDVSIALLHGTPQLPLLTAKEGAAFRAVLGELACLLVTIAEARTHTSERNEISESPNA